ncbi:uncharacterized protein M421DRAFT_416972 [Didymella exigua CBS 183.55]|uniref:Fanconi-associated nuclease n=1 Tax=Didymella exigua CBS 183.55 TaxID=1150837 RepID=A0A6A5RWL0_9PLEO|nr:uncharacterized protein M421DRAFT_416972 [Didymella exigua CBS 183.55]KAF1932252.1 hypothetical protein M421DRAFT_416972 [Didymella exigua CBS 183.55]
MVLNLRSPSKHNSMITRFIKHPTSTNFHGENDRSPKRRRIDDVTKPPTTPRKKRNFEDEIANSDGEDEGAVINQEPSDTKTDLESALPPIETGQEAIETYEAFKASQEEKPEGAEERLKDRAWIRGKSSLYVDAFNLALDTVLEEESHLFDEAETEVFRVWRNLNYEAQYLYVRLFLRKTSAWHRIRNLGYHSDLSDMDTAVEALQRTFDLPTSSAEVEIYPGEQEAPVDAALAKTFAFADRSEDEITTLDEASSLLRLDELKALAKDAKVHGKNKRELLTALQRTSKKQAGLGHVGLRRSDTDSSRQSRTSIQSSVSGTATPAPQEPEEGNWSDLSDSANRDAHFTRKIMSETGSCIRLSAPTRKLFERVHLVFYRSTEWTEKSLITIILAKIARRNFPEYIVSRSANIFASRSLLLEYEASIRTQFRIDNILEFNGRPTKRDYQEIVDVFEEVYSRWQILVEEEQRKEDSVYHSGEGSYLRRLSPAWVYTRIIHKAMYVLARRKEYQLEYDVTSALLGQRLFHHSRRGAWYQRKALIEEHYMATLSATQNWSEEQQKKHWKRIALRTCEVGLQDNLVHIIHHYDLQKRVTKLEKFLNIAKRLQHDFTHVRLTKPIEVTVNGTQILRPLPLNRRNSSPGPHRRSGKTIWLDSREGGECSVEAMCLSHYRNQEWKGFHSEGGILRTLFAYLFYDVLFTYVPNVFQTQYQTCPLDLHTDAFYPSRISEINARLNAISNGGAESIIRRVYAEHHEKRTCVVGLDWRYDVNDLYEIVRCFDGEALATVCKVMAQEYGQRGGGVPDLFLWKLASGEGEKGKVKFVEVKSENDRLSDTQRLWLHVLSGAGVKVELCAAVAEEVIQK